MHAVSGEPIPDLARFRDELFASLAPFRVGELGMPARGAPQTSSCDRGGDADEERRSACIVRGFSEHVGLADEAVAHMIEKSLPRPWFAHGGVRSICAMPREASHDDLCMTHVRADRRDDGVHIVVHPQASSVSDGMRALVRAMIHASDWHAPFYAPRIERELARLMHGQVSSHTRTPFASVASISFQDRDARARQYWTELLTLAFSVDALDEQEWLEALAHALYHRRVAHAYRDARSGVRLEIATIRRACALIDSDFAPWEAARQRTDLLHHAVRASYAKQAESCLESLPDDLRSSFALGIDRILHGRTSRSTPHLHPSSDLLASFPSDVGYGCMLADRIHEALAECAQLDGEIHSPLTHPSIVFLRRACEELAPILFRYPQPIRRHFAEAVAMRDPSANVRHLV